MQVKEYESITLEVTTTTQDFHKSVAEVEAMVDAELVAHRERLRTLSMQDSSDSEGLGYEET